MQISKNSTSMQAGLTVAVDKNGRDLCVVVLKGTFLVENDGKVRLADEQEPFVYADKHYGEPGTTSIKYECDFAPFKPMADVIINGRAFSPSGRPATELAVILELGFLKKQVKIIGDRLWEKTVTGLQPSTPAPFLEMPLQFERAFGGSDHSHPDPKYQGTEMRNPVGTGFHKNPDKHVIEGTSLPNIEYFGHTLRGWSDTPPPAGFGTIGRGWQPRIGFAGTYNDKWLEEKFPFLPDDFDHHYFQSVPQDQQVPFFQGGEQVRCTNMTTDGSFSFIVPKHELPIVYRFRDREVVVQPNLDTLLIEPDQHRFIVLWRAAIPIGRKLNALREIIVGKQPASSPKSTRNGKPRFKSLSEAIAWTRKYKRSQQK